MTPSTPRARSSWRSSPLKAGLTEVRTIKRSLPSKRTGGFLTEIKTALVHGQKRKFSCRYGSWTRQSGATAHVRPRIPAPRGASFGAGLRPMASCPCRTERFPILYPLDKIGSADGANGLTHHSCQNLPSWGKDTIGLADPFDLPFRGPAGAAAAPQRVGPPSPYSFYPNGKICQNCVPRVIAVKQSCYGIVKLSVFLQLYAHEKAAPPKGRRKAGCFFHYRP